MCGNGGGGLISGFDWLPIFLSWLTTWSILPVKVVALCNQAKNNRGNLVVRKKTVLNMGRVVRSLNVDVNFILVTGPGFLYWLESGSCLRQSAAESFFCCEHRMLVFFWWSGNILLMFISSLTFFEPETSLLVKWRFFHATSRKRFPVCRRCK